MKFLATLFIAAVFAVAAAPTQAATLTSGTLIKASGPAVYYYTAAGTRYVFPTEKTYKSWYADFSGVITVTDAELAAIPIGGNVTYRPGTRMVKITTDPKVYAVQGTELRWVTSETLAAELFGENWAAQIDDIPDPFFVNYTVGADITSTDDFSATAVRNAASTIQHVIDGTDATDESDEEAEEEPADEPNEEPNESTSDITLTLDKTTAQSNERIQILAQAPASIGAKTITLSIDGVGEITTCNTFSCTDGWVVPNAGVQSSYTVRAVLTQENGGQQEAIKTVTIESMPVTELAQITSNRLVLKPNQFPNIRAIVDTELKPTKTEIVLDGMPVKVCSTTPTDCPYIEYLTGPIGTTYEIYASVLTSDALTYKSPTVTITIAENDTPLVLLEAGKANIFMGETVDIGISAEDDDGIDTMTISHNGTLLKTCYGPVPCSVVTGPWNVSAGTELTFTGTATDPKGGTTTAFTTVTVQ